MRSTHPIKAVGIQNIIRRTYQESGPFQWARELLQNSLEAGATRVTFGVEWQAVERLGVYRRMVADNGHGMTRDQLLSYFSSLGGGGKAIGGIHENFGIGSKTSLMPWNQYGMVVLSWVHSQGSMIWVRQDPETGEFGLRLISVEQDDGSDSLEAVFPPFQDDAAGCDWRQVRPPWLKEHGTVVVLLGDRPNQDTVLGDPARGEREKDLKGVATYLNKRYWRIPEGVKVEVEELRNSDRKAWPKSRDAARGTGGTPRGTNMREVKGAFPYISYQKAANGNLAHQGAVTLADGTLAHWFLWEGGRPGVHSYAAEQGFVAGLYKGELYDATSHLATYRSFGVTSPEVRQRLWLVMEPRPYDPKTGVGVFPRGDRNSLLLVRGGEPGPLPYAAWGAEFADKMPQPIRDAIRASIQETGTIEDTTYREKLAELRGRWRVPRLRAVPGGDLTVDAGQPGTGQVIRLQDRDGGGGGGGEKGAKDQTAEPNPAGAGAEGAPKIGVVPGTQAARPARVGVGIPSYRAAAAGEVTEGAIAAWVPHEPGHPEGVVLLNVGHPTLQQQIRHWQGKYADHLADDVARVVVSVYGQSAVAKVAHSESFKSTWGAVAVEQEFRSEAALTMALGGLWDHDVQIATQLGARFGRQRVAAAAEEKARVAK